MVLLRRDNTTHVEKFPSKGGLDVRKEDWISLCIAFHAFVIVSISSYRVYRTVQMFICTMIQSSIT